MIIKLVGKRPKYIVHNPLLFCRWSADKRNAAYKDYEQLLVRDKENIIKNNIEYLH